MSNPIALILGGGLRVGAAVAAAFTREGYSVAIVSRKGTGTKTPEGYLSFQADFTNPDTIPPVFEAVKKELGGSPTVVVYNAAGFTPPPDKDSVLSVPSDRFASDLNLNTISPYVAAQESLKGWKSLPQDAKKTFIYTGNKSNVAVLPVPLTMTLGVGKSASAYWLGSADNVYSAQGIRRVFPSVGIVFVIMPSSNISSYRFFYADQRKEDGGLAGFDLDGPAHGAFYPQLAKHGDIPWQATFVKDKGYVKFE
jgi:NAD(P)-dependent dehydrogenase (short-subunit alcohol dehydrogenase family)